MTREEADFIGGMNMCDEISNEAYKKIMCYCEEQGPCDDCISRAAAINAISHAEVNFTVTSKIDFADYKREIQEIVDHIVEAQVKALNDLLSVSPQPKVGRWITSHIPESTLCECSSCGFTCGAYSFNYCPHCGAKMEVE